MKKKFFLILFSFSISLSSYSQVNGSDTVCAGYIYTFDAVVAGADSFIWSYPAAWAVINGGGTAQVQLLCTQNIGQVCVDAYDNGNYLGQFCHPVSWGGNSFGWDVQLTTWGMCQCPPISAAVISNGTGNNCAGCGNGVVSPNLAYVIYDNPWPTGNFYSYADGVSAFTSPMFTPLTCYVYLVDLTFGLPNAILIEGGICPATINNTFILNPCQYVNLGIIANPDPVCIGDTLTLAYDDQFTFFNSMSWYSTLGDITLFGGNGWDTILGVIHTPGTVDITLLCYDSFGCPSSGSLSLNYQVCNALLTGDSIVCAGYIYNYSVNIPGAVTYNWTLPSGWYGLIGQGTSSISATCNINDGDICVEGFDINAVSLGTQCIATQWGNGGTGGWDIVPSEVPFCNMIQSSANFYIVSNDTSAGGCPSGCGNGVQHPNLLYGLYDSNGYFYGAIDSSQINLPSFSAIYTAYYVDTTLGSNFPDAIVISGGCGGGVINNTVNVIEIFPDPLFLSQTPSVACIGDTVLVDAFTSDMNPWWYAVSGVVILSNPIPQQVLVIVTSIPATVHCSAINPYCLTGADLTLYIGTCNPLASFTAITNPICPGTCTGFSDLSSNATSYEWLFPGANPSSSTDMNPSNICYIIPGNYDVTLIASNSQGSDTLYAPNYITVLPYPPAQGILQSGDTLFANQGFTSYQWYYNGSLIAGATEYFYVATLSGDYNLISVDSNGCEVEAVYFGFIENISANEFSNLSITPNPALEKLEIKFSDDKVKLSSIFIYDMMGKQMKIPDALPTGKKSAVIDISALTPGIYFIEVSAGEKIIRRDFIKE